MLTPACQPRELSPQENPSVRLIQILTELIEAAQLLHALALDLQEKRSFIEAADLVHSDRLGTLPR